MMPRDAACCLNAFTSARYELLIVASCCRELPDVASPKRHEKRHAFSCKPVLYLCSTPQQFTHTPEAPGLIHWKRVAQSENERATFRENWRAAFREPLKGLCKRGCPSVGVRLPPSASSPQQAQREDFTRDAGLEPGDPPINRLMQVVYLASCRRTTISRSLNSFD